MSSRGFEGLERVQGGRRMVFIAGSATASVMLSRTRRHLRRGQLRAETASGSGTGPDGAVPERTAREGQGGAMAGVMRAGPRAGSVRPSVAMQGRGVNGRGRTGRG